MLRTLGIVELAPAVQKAGSPAAVLLNRRFAGHTLVEWVTRRMTDAMLLEQVVVLAGSRESEQEIGDLLPCNIPVFYDSGDWDATTRLAAAVRQYAADAVVRVSVKCPFLDPALIDRLVARAEAMPHCDYVSYVSTRSRTALLARMGVVAHWCRASAVTRAALLADHPEERQDVWNYICSHPETFRLAFVPVPGAMDRDDIRLSLEVDEDWEHAQMILDALGVENLDYQCIAGLLDDHPTVRQRMAAMNKEVGGLS